MLFVNRSKLLGRMAEENIKKKDLAEELCLTSTGLSNKLRGVRNFDENEIFVLAKRFGTDIFFLE